MILRTIVLTGALCAWGYGSAQAALLFTEHGTGTQTFGTAPSIESGWSTIPLPGGKGTYTSSAQLDAAAETLRAIGITNQLLTTSVVPPSESTFGYRWNSALGRIQSRVAGNGALALLTTLSNASAESVQAIVISYQYAGITSSDASIGEEIPGQRAYYSLTGEANTWNLIPELSNAPQGTFTNDLSVRIMIPGAWPPGSYLYLLWLDDNGFSDDVPPYKEGGYTMDNFSVSPGRNVEIGSPTNNSEYPFGAPITISASTFADGPITRVDFYDGGIPIGNDDTAPYSITKSNLQTGAHTLTAVSHDEFSNSQTSSVVTITVHPNAEPSISAVANDRAATHVLVGSSLVYTALATDDGAVSKVDFVVDGARRWTDATSPYIFGWCDMTAGIHTLKVIATDNSGASETNSSTITVTNPPATEILVANGSSWRYWDQGSDPGRGWEAKGYDDRGWSNGIAWIGYGHALANRPEGTVSRRYVGEIGAPGTTTNATQLFRLNFEVPSSILRTGVMVRLLADDGGVVYLNGTEIFRSSNMPLDSTYADFTLTDSGDGGSVFAEKLIDQNLLLPGQNTIAVEIHQVNNDSADLSFDLMLWGLRPPAPELRIALSSYPELLDLSWADLGGPHCIQFKANLSDAEWAEVFCPGPSYIAEDGWYHVSLDTSLLGPAGFLRLAPQGN
jgi:hypothetical protein